MTVPEVFKEVCANCGWPFVSGTIEIKLQGGRAQQISVNKFEADEGELVRITTRVGEASALSEHQLRSALAVNGGLAHGALAIVDGDVVLIDTFLATTATHDHVERSLRFLAETADRYEQVLFGTDQH